MFLNKLVVYRSFINVDVIIIPIFQYSMVFVDVDLFLLKYQTLKIIKRKKLL